VRLSRVLARRLIAKEGRSQLVGTVVDELVEDAVVVVHGIQARPLRRVSGHEQTMATRSDCWDRDRFVSYAKRRNIAPPNGE